MDSRRRIYRCGGAACGRCNVGGDAAGKTAGRSRRACSHPFGGQGDLRNRLRAPGFWLRKLAALDRLGLCHGWALPDRRSTHFSSRAPRLGAKRKRERQSCQLPDERRAQSRCSRRQPNEHDELAQLAQPEHRTRNNRAEQPISTR